MPNTTSNRALNDCDLAFDVITDSYAKIARAFFMLLQIIQVIAFLVLTMEFRRIRVAMHGNLKFLYIHLTLIYQLASIGYPMAEIRNMALSFIYNKPDCALLTPIWYIVISRGMSLLYAYAIPFMHFTIMYERYRATKLAEHYEFEGNHFGWITVGVIYILAFAMTISVEWLFLSDNAFDLQKQLSFNTALSKSNGDLANYYTIIQIALIVSTVIGDVWVFQLNKRLKRQRVIMHYAVRNHRVMTQHQQRYNLSEKYQLHENWTAMRLILPLDITYLFFILFFNILVIILRNNKDDMRLATFLAHYNMLSCLLTLYTIISLIIYRQFLLNIGIGAKRAAKNARIMPVAQVGQCYFEQLNQQWNLE